MPLVGTLDFKEMKHKQIMELPPELRRLIAEYLEPNDAFACMHVSRDWYDSFSEPAFKSIELQSGERLPSLGWMQKYGQFIRQLNLNGEIPLPHLVATTNPRENHQKDRRHAMVLLPNLKKLTIRAHSTLTEVEKWLSHCPRLETLFVRNIKSLPATDTDRGVHLLQHCPRLSWLDIDNDKELRGSLQVDDLIEIISHCPLSLTAFGLMDTSFPSHRPWFEALSGVLSRLTVLEIDIYPKMKSWMVKRILCSCPVLVELRDLNFDVDKLFIDADVGKAAKASSVIATSTAVSAFEEKGAGMEAWACTGLRKLSFFFIEWSASPMRNKAAMEHLGLLRDLKRLEISGMGGRMETEEEWSSFLDDYPWPEATGCSCQYSAEEMKTGPEAQRLREVWPVLERFDFGWWDRLRMR